MATATEKQALGLPSDATEEQVVEAIKSLSTARTQAEEAEAQKAAAEKRVAALEKQAAKAAATSGKNGSATETPRVIDPDVVPGENQVRTTRGIEDTVEKRVKILSTHWTTLEPSPTTKGNFVEVEHRAVRNDVVRVPLSVAERQSKPDIDAFFRDVDPTTTAETEPGVYDFTKMSEADLINWHRSTKPDVTTVVDAAGGDPDIARRLIGAETTATGGDPREEVVSALAEIVARGNS